MFSLNLITPIYDAPILKDYEGPIPREGETVRVAGNPFTVSEIEFQFALHSEAEYKLRAVDVYLDIPMEVTVTQ